MSLESFIYHITQVSAEPPNFVSKSRWGGMFLYVVARAKEFNCSIKDLPIFEERARNEGRDNYSSSGW